MPRVLLTGATGAIGGAIARGLAKQSVVLYLTARNEQKGSDVRYRFMFETFLEFAGDVCNQNILSRSAKS